MEPGAIDATPHNASDGNNGQRTVVRCKPYTKEQISKGELRPL